MMRGMSGDGEAWVGLRGEPGVFSGGEPRLLLIDTCGREAWVAVTTGAEVVAERRFVGRGAAERLLGEVRAVLGEAACELGSLSAIGVVRGPGSFTGARVGLAMAKGLAEGAGLGLIAMSRLEVLAGKFWERERASVSVLEAGRGEMFWARFAAGAMVGEGLATAEELAGMCAGAEVFGDTAEGGSVAMSAGLGVGLALRRLAAGEMANPLLLDALYLRRTEAELLERQAAHRALP